MLPPSAPWVHVAECRVDKKWLALLKEAMATPIRVGVVFNPLDPAGPAMFAASESAARSLTLELQRLDVRDPNELARSFEAARSEGASRPSLSASL